MGNHLETKMQNSEEKDILTQVIQKQMVVLGSNIALEVARTVKGLKVDDFGKVDFSGDFVLVFKALAEEYIKLSGSVFEMSLAGVFEKYPQIKILISRTSA